MDNPPLAMYHKSCNDGFTAAWLFWRYVNKDAEFVPIQYGEAPPDVTGRDVYVLDFSFKRDVMEAMAAKAKSINVYDHHKTAKDELLGLPYCRFDMHKSGARIVWEELCPVFSTYDKSACPWLVDYTEDRDLWLWKLPHSEAINAAIASFDRTFENWEKMHIEYMSNGMDLVHAGEGILRFQEKLVKSATFRDNVGTALIAGYEVPCTNATNLISEICGTLAKGQAFAATYFITKDGVVFNLRSDDEGDDVSEIAKEYGGGGHAHAAGFKIPLKDLCNFLKQG